MNSVGLSPAGWYPDPSGARQWRVWTGTAWSSTTREYGDGPAPSVAVANVRLYSAMRHVAGLGVVGVVGGFALLVGVLSHWPGSVHPTPAWFADGSLAIALGAMVLGSVICATGSHAFDGRWRLGALLPGLNLFVVTARATTSMGRPGWWRPLVEVWLLVLFAATLRTDPWAGIAPVLVAYAEAGWLAAFLERQRDLLGVGRHLALRPVEG